MPTVHLNYFAVLRERAGKAEEERVTDAPTLRKLYDELRDEHGFALEADHVRVAVGESYVALDTAVTDGMEVTFIPPVAGG